MTFSIPTLMPEDIECRVQQVKETQSGVGAAVLLYKNARVDMRILDDVFGPMNWQREHARDNANCIISVWDSEKNQWIRKEDTGTESNTEAEKGLASDSFKRAGFNWGIGRELYTAPFIWIILHSDEFYKDKNGKKMSDGYLKDEISKMDSVFADVYDQASGYVHLSEKAFYQMVASCEDNKINLYAGPNLLERHNHILIEAAEAFIHFVKLHFKMLKAVAESKERFDIN